MANPARYSAAERLIAKLRDVSSCEIRADADGTITAVHVTALAGRSPKQIARDVESILAAEEGVELDHRKISVAQFAAADLPGAQTIERMTVAGVSVHRGQGAIEVEVRLSAGPIQAEGRAIGADTRFDASRVVGEATLDAIAKLVDGDPGLSLGELEEKGLGSTKVLLACVNRRREGAETRFMGCCEISYDPTLSVIHAILDAVNRFVGTLGPREPVEYRIGPAPVEG